jgi:hypothetical protein
MTCERQSCDRAAEAQITILGSKQEPRLWHLCHDHYHEVLVVAEMMRRLTGIPKIYAERTTDGDSSR